MKHLIGEMETICTPLFFLRLFFIRFPKLPPPRPVALNRRKVCSSDTLHLVLHNRCSRDGASPFRMSPLLSWIYSYLGPEFSTKIVFWVPEIGHLCQWPLYLQTGLNFRQCFSQHILPGLFFFLPSTMLTFASRKETENISSYTSHICTSILSAQCIFLYLNCLILTTISTITQFTIKWLFFLFPRLSVFLNNNKFHFTFLPKWPLTGIVVDTKETKGSLMLC